MRGGATRQWAGQARLLAQGLRDKVTARVERRFAVRLAGAAVATGGLALMGFGTVGSPLSGGALASPPTSNQAITNITVNCAGGITTGTLTVTGAVTGDTVTLEVFAHNPGDGVWHPTGATETITMAAGTSDYSYTISGVPASFADGTVSGDDGNDSADPDAPGDDFNAWRVQVESTVGAFAGTTTKSASYECSAASTTTTSSTTSSTSTASTTTSTTSTSTTSSSTTSTTSSTPATTSSTSSTSTPTTSSSSSSSSSTTTSSTETAPGSTTTTSRSASSSTAPASTSTALTPGTGVGAASTPSTGAADGEFGIGLGLLIAGGGLVAAAARIGRRPKK